MIRLRWTWTACNFRIEVDMEMKPIKTACATTAIRTTNCSSCLVSCFVLRCQSLSIHPSIWRIITELMKLMDLIISWHENCAKHTNTHTHIDRKSNLDGFFFVFYLNPDAFHPIKMDQIVMFWERERFWAGYDFVFVLCFPTDTSQTHLYLLNGKNAEPTQERFDRRVWLLFFEHLSKLLKCDN